MGIEGLGVDYSVYIKYANNLLREAYDTSGSYSTLVRIRRLGGQLLRMFALDVQEAGVASGAAKGML